MSSPVVLYSLVGLIVGAFLNFLLTGGSTHTSDLLLGAIFGLAVGAILALGKTNLWGRK